MERQVDDYFSEIQHDKKSNISENITLIFTVTKRELEDLQDFVEEMVTSKKHCKKGLFM